MKTVPILLRGNWLADGEISETEVNHAAGATDAAPIYKSRLEKFWDHVKDMFCTTRRIEAKGYLNDMMAQGKSDQKLIESLLNLFGMASNAQLSRFNAYCDPTDHRYAIISISQSPISIRVLRRVLLEQAHYDPEYCRLTLAEHLKGVGATTGFDPKDASTTLTQHLAEQRAPESQVWGTMEGWFLKCEAPKAKGYLEDFLSPFTCATTKRHCFAKMREMALGQYKSHFRRQETYVGSELLRLVGASNRHVRPEFNGIEEDRFEKELKELTGRLPLVDEVDKRYEKMMMEEEKLERGNKKM
ncbi:hypothetical protein [Pandoraea sputorum]|nr:hypothetical protein [Pandoraea sputorum]